MASKDSNNEYSHRRDLFQKADGQPMRFFMRPCNERAAVQGPVEYGGGVISAKCHPDSIKLVPASSVVVNGVAYSSNFIWDCIKANRLMELNKYKVVEKCVGNSDIENDGNDDGFCRHTNRYAPIPRSISKGRTEYNIDEDMAIIAYIIRTKQFNIVGGNILWKKLEELKIVRNRTWQSLKERFRRSILPRIKSYNISKADVARFQNISPPIKHNGRVETDDDDDDSCSLVSSRSSKRMVYTSEEDVSILHYIIEKDRLDQVKGNEVWKRMERNKVTEHTWQSMKGRFRVIVKNLSKYDLATKDKRRIEQCFSNLDTTDDSSFFESYKKRKTEHATTADITSSSDESRASFKTAKLEPANIKKGFKYAVEYVPNPKKKKKIELVNGNKSNSLRPNTDTRSRSDGEEEFVESELKSKRNNANEKSTENERNATASVRNPPSVRTLAPKTLAIYDVIPSPKSRVPQKSPAICSSASEVPESRRLSLLTNKKTKQTQLPEKHAAFSEKALLPVIGNAASCLTGGQFISGADQAKEEGHRIGEKDQTTEKEDRVREDEEPAIKDRVREEEHRVREGEEDAREEEHRVIEEPTREEHRVIEEPTREEHRVIEEPTREEHRVIEEPTGEEHRVIEEPTREEEDRVSEEVDKAIEEYDDDEDRALTIESWLELQSSSGEEDEVIPVAHLNQIQNSREGSIIMDSNPGSENWRPPLQNSNIVEHSTAGGHSPAAIGEMPSIVNEVLSDTNIFTPEKHFEFLQWIGVNLSLNSAQLLEVLQLLYKRKSHCFLKAVAAGMDFAEVSDEN